MNLVLLGGLNPSNKEWIEEVHDSLQSSFDEVAVLHYAHWQRGDREMDIPGEMDRLVETTSSWTDFAVFAKSAGTWLTLWDLTST
jgi:hypothetical protein